MFGMGDNDDQNNDQTAAPATDVTEETAPETTGDAAAPEAAAPAAEGDDATPAPEMPAEGEGSGEETPDEPVV